MLTDEKRKKLLAGVLAAVMLTSVAGCGSDKDSEWQNDNAAQDEKKDENGSSGGFFNGFFPWYFIGRTFGVGPMAGVRSTQQSAPKTSAPKATQQQQDENSVTGAGGTVGRTKTASGSSVQQGSGTTQKSTLGSTGTSGKSGIGSGLSRSSGSAIS